MSCFSWLVRLQMLYKPNPQGTTPFPLFSPPSISTHSRSIASCHSFVPFFKPSLIGIYHERHPVAAPSGRAGTRTCLISDLKHPFRPRSLYRHRSSARTPEEVLHHNGFDHKTHRTYRTPRSQDWRRDICFPAPEGEGGIRGSYSIVSYFSMEYQLLAGGRSGGEDGRTARHSHDGRSSTFYNPEPAWFRHIFSVVVRFSLFTPIPLPTSLEIPT